MNDLSITTDYSRYPSTCESTVWKGSSVVLTKYFVDIKDSMTVHRGKSPGTAFTDKMLQCVGLYRNELSTIHNIPGWRDTKFVGSIVISN